MIYNPKAGMIHRQITITSMLAAATHFPCKSWVLFLNLRWVYWPVSLLPYNAPKTKCLKTKLQIFMLSGSDDPDCSSVLHTNGGFTPRGCLFL